MNNPPGYILGYHYPGSLWPVAAMGDETARMRAQAEQADAIARANAAEEQRKRRRNHLLLHRR